MGCLKLSYYKEGNALEKNSFQGLKAIKGSEQFWDTHVGKKAGEQKKRVITDHLGNGRVLTKMEFLLSNICHVECQ